MSRTNSPSLTWPIDADDEFALGALQCTSMSQRVGPILASCFIANYKASSLMEVNWNATENAAVCEDGITTRCSLYKGSKSFHRVRPIRKKPNKAPQSTRRKFNNRNNTGSESRSVPWQLNVNSPCAGVRFYGHLRYRLSLFFVCNKSS